jgi:tetratricopeptide (TPR) repeat protein
MGAEADDLAVSPATQRDDSPPASAETRQGSAGSASRPSGGRLWLFRLTALVVVPALLLLAFELVLRLVGFGYPTGFALKKSVHGQAVYVRNTDFPRRFFPEGLGRLPLPFEISASKPPGTYRVFILGASAAMGVPEPPFGFGRILEVQLRARYPEGEIELVNCAATAINSHVVLEIAKDCAELDPDLFIVYLGNNEVVGPFGAGTVLAPFSPSLMAVRAGLKLKSTRIGQLFGSLLASASSAARPHRWEGMQMFLGNQVSADDPALEVVYEHFAENLGDICRIAKSHGVPVILCTVATNLKDCPPFASQHRGNLSDAEEKAWDTEYEKGVALEAGGNQAGAIERFLAAAAIDDRYADLHYRLGCCYWALEDYERARRHFVNARELDTLRFRADGRINNIIRTLAQERSAARVHLVDVETVFEANSPHATPGKELFYEHVHMNFSGNHLLATTVLEQVETLLPDWVKQDAATDTPPLSEAECAARLAYTVWDRHRISRQLLRLFFMQPPFTNQLYHSQAVDKLERELEVLDVSGNAEMLWQIDEQYRQAIDGNPSDTWLHFNYALFLASTSQDDRAIEQQLRLCLELLPDDAESLNSLALRLKHRQRFDQARQVFEQALEISPDNAGIRMNLADTLARAGEFDEAFAQYEIAVQLEPDNPLTYASRGAAWRAHGKVEQAIEDFRRALAIQPDFTAAHSDLAAILSSQGKFDEAKEHLQQVLKVSPNDAATHHGLGVILQGQGRLPEAARHYQAALEANPDEAMTHNRLGQTLAQMGQPVAALQHLRAAIGLRPDWPSPMSEVAWILATCRDPSVHDAEAAVEWAERACPAGDCTKARFLDILAAAYAEAGRFSDAVEAARAALARTSPENAGELAERERRLRLYETRRPYQPPAAPTP